MKIINTLVKIKAGKHAGERGKIIALPTKKSDENYTVLLVGGRGIVVAGNDLEVVEDE